MPVGRYVPEFIDGEGAGAFVSPAHAAPVGPLDRDQIASGGRWPAWLVQALVAALLTLVIGLGVLAATLRQPLAPPAIAAPPGEPTVLVGEFANLTGAPELDPLGLQLSSAVRESLVPFEEMDVLPVDPTSGRPARSPPARTCCPGSSTRRLRESRSRQRFRTMRERRFGTRPIPSQRRRDEKRRPSRPSRGRLPANSGRSVGRCTRWGGVGSTRSRDHWRRSTHMCASSPIIWLGKAAHRRRSPMRWRASNDC